MDTPHDQLLQELRKQANKVLDRSSRPLPEGWLEDARQCGSPLLKEALVDGAYYLGYCRNASLARWSAKRSQFVYIRHKFGDFYAEAINHPEDDNGYDFFVPLLKFPETEQVVAEKVVTDENLINAY